jgi:hypothetical protein
MALSAHIWTAPVVLGREGNHDYAVDVPNSFSRLADVRIKQYVAALQTIAGQETDLDALAPDQALAKLRDVITITRRALERQGLAASAWDWVADLEFRPQNK